MSGPVIKLNDDTYAKMEQAIQETFSLVLGLNLQRTDFYLGSVKNPPKHISGYSVLKNPMTRGIFSIGFPPETAFRIFSSFYGAAIDQIDDRVIEGIGELTNMIYGCLKKQFNDEGFDLEMYVPYVLVQDKFCDFSDFGPGKAVTLHFGTSVGAFWVELKLNKKIKSKKPKPAKLSSQRKKAA